MHIGRVQRRFTAEPILSPVPGAEAPVEEPVVPAPEPADAVTAGTRAGVDPTP